MKRILVSLLIVTLVIALLAPATAFARGGPHNDDDEGEGKKYALIIGISDYPGEGSVLEGGLDLFYADDDARTVTAVLTDVLGFDSENVITLTDGAATRRSIMNSLAKLQREVEEEDSIIFFFAGHVLRPDQLGMPAVPGVAGMAVWPEAPNRGRPLDIIWDKDLRAAFKRFKTDNITFIFDACSAESFSELAEDGRTLISATDLDGVSGEIGEAYAEIFGDMIPAELSYLLEVNNGLFTYFFFEEGILYGFADGADGSDPDGSVSFQEAFGYAQYILTLITDMSGGLLDEIPVWISSE